MMKRSVALLASVALCAGGAPAFAKDLVPLRQGQCVTTTVTEVGYRLQGMPDSGSSIAYSDGLFQTTYDVEPGIYTSRKYDRVRLCLISLPTGCPPGDDRGKVYKAMNLRTQRSWEAADSEHSCGGA